MAAPSTAACSFLMGCSGTAIAVARAVPTGADAESKLALGGQTRLPLQRPPRSMRCMPA
eukprot:CAMPEP_0179261138 /NCGR_PEP_ID=MMETSP0797-20121207/26703_1 /TAXON_ID=47934 /ORGANISM="Dinophysis acuminata, Strain DAEP01" /LENGTH=58 /DNA_ID=CAMNT_0020969245 /DNA_START=24 /DNA_END=200 /DNA_ORIENTATION=+